MSNLSDLILPRIGISGYSGYSGVSGFKPSGYSGVSGSTGTSGSGAVDVTVTAGENITIRDFVYLEVSGTTGTAGRAYKADADSVRNSTNSFYLGFAIESFNAGNTGKVRIMGALGGFSSLTTGAPYYASATSGEITSTKPTNGLLVAMAISTTEIVINCYGDQTDVNDYVDGTNGYFGGGFSDSGGGGDLVKTSDKIVFSTDVTSASTVSDLTVAKASYQSLSDGGINGYFAGGASEGITADVDKITFSSSVTSSCTSAVLSRIKYLGAAASDLSTKGYFTGGCTVGSIYEANADKITFSSETTAACTSANLTAARYGHAGINGGSTKGYFAGGWIDPSPSAVCDKTLFSTDTTSAVTTGNLSSARSSLDALSNNLTKGYFGGGYTGALVTTSDKITFSSDITAACTTANLSTSKGLYAGVTSGQTKGYMAGGYTGALVTVATTDKLTYSSDTTAASTVSNLSLKRDQFGGVSDAI